MEKHEKKSPGALFAAWVQRNRVGLLVAAGVIIAVLIGGSIYSAVMNARFEKADQVLLDFEKVYNAWISAPEDAKDDAADAVLSDFAALEKDFGGTWAHQRSLFLMGDFHYSREEWSEARDSYLNLAEAYSKSYLAPVSLFNAAAASEENGESGEAADLYGRIVDEYPDSPLAARALFASGRIAEGSAAAEAVTVYNRLIELYPQSSWTKLARSRIIDLKIAE